MNDNFVERFIEACKSLAEKVGEVFEQIKAIFKELTAIFAENERKEKLKQTWHTPNKLIKSHQVLDRKPRYAVARSKC